MLDQIVEKLPELQRLEATVSDLEAKHGEASARAQALTHKVQQAREVDLNREAFALNAGRKPPNATEPSLREQSEGAHRDAEVLQRRLALAVADRGRYLADHHKEILSLLEQAHAAEGERVASAASDALTALLAYFKAEDDARGLQRLHPTPTLENVGGPESMVTVWGPQTTANATGGPSRGSLEGTLQYLVSLGTPTIVEAVEEGDGDEDAA
jgi:hypothetical protein